MIHWFVASTRIKAPRKTRTWGYFKDKEEAISHVKNSSSFYYEAGYYTHVVIEGVPPADEGSPWDDREEIWFELGENKVTECERPEEFDKIICFTMG
jgi:hypothetical protein